MDAQILFFGYGSNRDEKRLESILEEVPTGGYGAIISNYSLAYQTLKQIPEEPAKILRQAWGDRFMAYTLKKGNGIVAGRVWELTPGQLEAIKSWEFEGKWREFIKVKAATFNNKIIEVITEKAIGNQQIMSVVDGIEYEPNINSDPKKSPLSQKDDQYRTREIQRIRKELNILKVDKNYGRPNNQQ